jgi:pyroglutamyl-peptidase
MSGVGREPLILATGFSEFPDAPENPTAWAIGELEREAWRPAGARLATRVLSVRYDLWDEEVVPLLDREPPDAVIAFGLSAKAVGFTLESTARNQLGLGRLDAAGACASSDKIHTHGPATQYSRLPLRKIASALQRHAIPCVASDDAGDYICNLLFYRLMTRAATAGAPETAGFIHVPYLDDQLPRLARAGLATNHLKTLTKAQLMLGTRVILGQVAETLSARAKLAG